MNGENTPIENLVEEGCICHVCGERIFDDFIAKCEKCKKVTCHWCKSKTRVDNLKWVVCNMCDESPGI